MSIDAARPTNPTAAATGVTDLASPSVRMNSVRDLTAVVDAMAPHLRLRSGELAAILSTPVGGGPASA